MTPRHFVLLLVCTLGCTPAAAAQQAPTTAKWAASGPIELIPQDDGSRIVKLSENVELEQGDTKVFGDYVEYFESDERVVASGNVVVSQGNNTIAAERGEFNLRTRTGTFYNASGSANIKPPSPSGSGFAPPPSTEETDVYFFGEKVEKTGARRYRITNGGFTTCVQPTPRWNLNANTVNLNIDDYTLLRNAIFRVKNVPLLYLPILYYPTKEEDRSTGFLLPTYSSSTLRGQSISNAFFWAINRSHDAKFLHDWYSKTGQGYGGEYRYNLGIGDGSLRAYLLDEHAATYAVPGGASTAPERRVFDIRGAGQHRLPFNLRASAQVDYSSDIITMQTFYTDVNSTARNQRGFGGNLTGAWGVNSLNVMVTRRENFYNATDSFLYGDTPRVAFNRGERPLFAGAPVYFSVNSEFAGIERESRRDGAAISDAGLMRLNLAPQLSFPFKRWQWFTVNSTLSWRDTYYSRSYAADGSGRLVDDDINRRYFTFAARLVGPVFNRVWDTPDRGYAERFKHTVEPFLDLTRTSSIDNYSRIVQTDGIDNAVGNATTYTYGVNNRFYAKRRIGQTSQAQEIVSVAVLQTYYTDERSASNDPQYGTSGSGAPPTHFSPIYVNVNATPAQSFSAALRAEVDSRYRELRTMSVSTGYNWAGRLQTNVGWSKRFHIAELEGFNDPNRLDHLLNVSTNIRTRDNRYGGLYSLSYDVFRSTFVNQSLQAFYNAQCCGIAAQYSQLGFAAIPNVTLPRNRTFFLSFTLAGLGNFSPFSGALGAVPR